MQDPHDSLDDLFAEAMQAERLHPQKPRMKAARLEPAKPLKFSDKYTLPENWIPERTIALIHAETNTLLGNFLVYSHKSDRVAKKWIRVEEPTQVSGVERVSGSQWLREDREIPSPHQEMQRREVLLPDLALQELGVHASNVLCHACLMWGGIVRLELAQHTTFHSPDARTVITLGAGVNVLEAMSLDAKIALRAELML